MVEFTSHLSILTVRSRNLVKQELPTLPKHLSLYLVFSGVGVARSLVFCVVFCKSLFALFSFGHCDVCPSRFKDSDYPFAIFKLLTYANNNF